MTGNDISVLWGGELMGGSALRIVFSERARRKAAVATIGLIGGAAACLNSRSGGTPGKSIVVTLRRWDDSYLRG